MGEAFGAVVIGSGFGATVAASHLAANQDRSVLILEKGAWWQTPERPLPGFFSAHPDEPVEYWPRPNHLGGLLDLLAVVQTNQRPGLLERLRDWYRETFTDRRKPRALFRYSTFPDISVVTANGVGGGSLIYSNVSLAPFFDPSTNRYPVMDAWPQAARLTPEDYVGARAWAEAKRGKTNKVFTRIPIMGQTNPDELLYLGKSRWLKTASTRVKASWDTLSHDAVRGFDIADWEALELSIFEYGADFAGNGGFFCERQGRCILGCLPGARHTLDRTIIDKLADRNVAVRGGMEVIEIRRNDTKAASRRWTIVYRPTGTDDLRLVEANTVVIGAGTLGSTELLLRNQDWLYPSQRLGTRFSSNGDFLGFVVSNASPPDPPWQAGRGPVITGHVAVHNGKLFATLEDGAIPGMFAEPVRAALHVLEKAVHHKASFMNTMRAIWSRKTRKELAKFLPISDPYDPQRSRTEDELMMDVFVFNCMGSDGASGKFSLDDGELALACPDLKNHPIYATYEAVMSEMAKQMNGRFLPSPVWRGFADKKLVSVHPLGGCPIGSSADDGVVNELGQMFDASDPQHKRRVHPGLYVVDGSIVPDALAVNPTFTIMTLANRIGSQALVNEPL